METKMRNPNKKEKIAYASHNEYVIVAHYALAM